MFYRVKPLIPRPIQIALRRHLARHKRPLFQQVWPIDERAGALPQGWCGWPDGKEFALVLMHDVDSACGRDKCRDLMDLEQGLGFRSSFNFVPEGYPLDAELRQEIVQKGFETAVHGLTHDGRLCSSRKIFERRARRINEYLKDWQAVGFSSPSMHHRLDWMYLLHMAYATSTFDTDPFEPQPDGVGTIFPFWVKSPIGAGGYVELPYTLCQDHCLFIIMEEKGIDIWKKKLDWIAQKGGMALLNSHPDYMNFQNGSGAREEYPASYYKAFLEYVKRAYKDAYWQPLPKDLARFWSEEMVGNETG